MPARVDAGERTDPEQRQRRHRQDELGEHRAERVRQSPASSGIDRPEAGDLVRRRLDDVEPAERRRRPVEEVVEDEDQQRGRGRRSARPGPTVETRLQMPVDDAAGRSAAPMPSGRPMQRREEERAEGQLERGRQAVPDIVEDRLAGGERIAEIAAREVADIGDELLEQSCRRGRGAPASPRSRPGVAAGPAK